MLSHSTLDLHNSSRVFLLENFFPTQLATDLLRLFKAGPGHNSWKILTGHSQAVDRYHYTGSSSILSNAHQYAMSESVCDYFSKLLGKPVVPATTGLVDGIALWIDQAGYSIPPHRDLDPYQYAAQIYITDTPNTTSGTTIYNTQNQPIVQLPLRQNFGYFIDRTTTVMHGIDTPVPDNCNRYSVYMKYQTT